MQEETSIDRFKLNVGAFTDVKLCEIIVSFRYLGMMKDEALICMIELARRRMLGDEFLYEDYIQRLYDSMPKVKIDPKGMFGIDLNALKGMIG